MAMALGRLPQPLVLPNRVWEEVMMDFIDRLPPLDGYFMILVIVECLNEYAHFIPLRHPCSAVTVAMAFVQEVVMLHGILESIV